MANAQRAKNQQPQQQRLTPTPTTFRSNDTETSLRLHNNGSHFNHFNDTIIPSQRLATTSSASLLAKSQHSSPMVSEAVAATTTTTASVMTTTTTLAQNVSKTQLPDLSRANSSSSNHKTNNYENVPSAKRRSSSSSSNVDGPSHKREKKNHSRDDADAANELPQADSLPIDLSLSSSSSSSSTRLPEFPHRSDAVYFIIAVSGGAKIWARTLARTLIEMGAPFDSPQGPPLRPLYIDLPANGRWVRVANIRPQISGALLNCRIFYDFIESNWFNRFWWISILNSSKRVAHTKWITSFCHRVTELERLLNVFHRRTSVGRW